MGLSPCLPCWPWLPDLKIGYIGKLSDKLSIVQVHVHVQAELKVEVEAEVEVEGWSLMAISPNSL